MSPHAPDPCPHTTAVLARLLDGDVDAPLRPELASDPAAATDHAEFEGCAAPADALSTHLRHCASCQQTLQRARRLDAMLAQGSGRRLRRGDEARREQWLQRALTAVVPLAPIDRPAVDLQDVDLPDVDLQDDAAAPGSAMPAGAAASPAAPPRTRCSARGHGRRWTTAAAVAMVAPLLQWLAPATVADAPTSPAPAPALIASVDGPILLSMPPGQRRRPPRPARPDVDQPIAPAPGELQQRLAAEHLPLPDRLAAAHELLQRTRPFAPAAGAATDALLLTAAGCGDRCAAAAQLHHQLLAWLREAPWLLDRLAERLRRLDAPGTELGSLDLAGLTVAARLGCEQLDRPLRLLLRRHPDAVTALCAALRCGSRSDGGATLLLDIWQDLVARDRVGDDERTAQAWFPGQPEVMFAALATEFERGTDASRRRRCLLALAHAADAASCRLLAALLRSPRRDEANLAAYALSRQPRHHLQPLLPAAFAADACLLRAALATADLPATRPWVEQLALRPEQRQRLAHATATDFVVLVNWFRRAPRPIEFDAVDATTD